LAKGKTKKKKKKKDAVGSVHPRKYRVLDADQFALMFMHRAAELPD